MVDYAEELKNAVKRAEKAIKAVKAFIKRSTDQSALLGASQPQDVRYMKRIDSASGHIDIHALNRSDHFSENELTEMLGEDKNRTQEDQSWASTPRLIGKSQPSSQESFNKLKQENVELKARLEEKRAMVCFLKDLVKQKEKKESEVIPQFGELLKKIGAQAILEDGLRSKEKPVLGGSRQFGPKIPSFVDSPRIGLERDSVGNEVIPGEKGGPRGPKIQLEAARNMLAKCTQTQPFSGAKTVQENVLQPEEFSRKVISNFKVIATESFNELLISNKNCTTIAAKDSESFLIAKLGVGLVIKEGERIIYAEQPSESKTKSQKCQKLHFQ